MHKATNIIWDFEDSDFDDCEMPDLPAEIEIPESVNIEDDDMVSDYISSVTGFCHKGFGLSIDENESDNYNGTERSEQVRSALFPNDSVLGATDRQGIEEDIRRQMCLAASDEYADRILSSVSPETGISLMDDIVQNVLETSAWVDEGFYNDSDVRLAIGRELMARLGIES